MFFAYSTLILAVIDILLLLRRRRAMRRENPHYREMSAEEILRREG